MDSFMLFLSLMYWGKRKLGAYEYAIQHTYMLTIALESQNREKLKNRITFRPPIL